jgi:hypothetical protein
MKSDSFNLVVGKKVAQFLETLEPPMPLAEISKMEPANIVSYLK